MKPIEPESAESLTSPRGAAAYERDAIEMVPLTMHMKSILVPIDFSETSRKALRYAVPFAKQFEAKIALLHVIELPLAPPEAGFLPYDESGMLARQTKNLADLAARAIAPELVGEIIVRSGAAWDTVVAVARETQADLIITTTHGYTGLKHVFLGSTAERIVRHAPCPVLVVREKEHEFV